VTELSRLLTGFSPKTSWLAENGHQSAEFRQGLAKGSFRYEKRNASNSLIFHEINNIDYFGVWQRSCAIESGHKFGVRQWVFERGGP